MVFFLNSNYPSLAANANAAAAALQPQTCHFKLIKTEEEINLAINKAQQFINKLPAASSAPAKAVRQPLEAQSKAGKATPTLGNLTIEASPKYKCCRCVQSPVTAGSQFQPIVLYTYQDALDHVMQVHIYIHFFFFDIYQNLRSVIAQKLLLQLILNFQCHYH